MVKEFNKHIVNLILEKIFPLPKNFGITLEEGGESVEPTAYWNIRRKLMSIDPMIELYFGVSKLVIDSTLLPNIVIKIPFNGLYEYEFNERTGKFSELVWKPFTGATFISPSDYCLKECEKFNELKKEKLHCFIAETHLFKTVDNINIFIQEKIRRLKEVHDIPKASKETKKIIQNLYANGDLDIDINTIWFAKSINDYGENKVKHFLDYCNNIDFDILEDIHDDNIGYRLNGTPCIFDYSSFND